MKDSLYERIGGENAVMAAVDLFYAKVMADEVTRPFFEQLDMPAQIRKQVAFMARAFGGPDAYQGRDVRSAHAALVKSKGLTDVHFDAVARHLRETLLELGVEGALVEEALATIGSVRNDVLGR